MPYERSVQYVRSQTAGITLILLAAAGSQVRADPITLGQASSFGVLAGSTVTNTGPSVVHGNVGVSPGSAITGFPPGTLVGGTMHSADSVALQAQTDLTTAYNVIAGETPTQDLTGQDLGGLILTPGVYHFASSAQLSGALTLNALGDPNARFDFQIGSTLTTASLSSVTIINNGGNSDSADNLYWQVGSSATLGTGTEFLGNILALVSITLTTGATDFEGRALARNGAVTMDSNTVGFNAVSSVNSPEPSTAAYVIFSGLPLAFLVQRRRGRRQ